VLLEQTSRLATSYAFLNTRLPPFNNILARRALNYAVDRTEAIRERGTSQPLEATCQILPPGMPGFRPYCPYTLNPDPVSGHWTAPDLAKAKELVRKSGTLGQPVTVWEPPTTVDPPAAYFVKLLNELGYHAHSHPPFSSLLDYFERIQRGDAQIGMLGITYAPRGDDGVQALTCGSILNVGHYCNPKIDAEYKQGLALEQTDPPAARALWHKIDTQLVDAAALVPVWNPGSSVLISERVGNWQNNDALGPLVDQLWVN
jgi:peptide/nickel transport system substrate-binding protein